jgi:hypothetical protein
MSDQPTEKKSNGPISRRKFLHYCSNAVLITAAYQAFSLFGQDESEAGKPLDRCRWMCQACTTCMTTTSLRG